MRATALGYETSSRLDSSLKELALFWRHLKDSVRALAWILIRAFTSAEENRLQSPGAGPHMAALVHSFDGYKRFWQPAAHYTAANLPARMPLYFATERIPYSPGRFVSISTGSGSFVDRMIEALKRLEQAGFRFVLYLQEDMWINERVTHALLTDLEQMMTEYRLDCVKLGTQPFPQDLQEIQKSSGRVGTHGISRDFRWFGHHRFALSHHPSIFRIRFLIEMSYAARTFNKVTPLEQERFCTAYLQPRTKAIADDRKRYRIAVFSGKPVISYVHASSAGRITAEALSILKADGIEAYFDPGLDEEISPR